MIDMTDERAAEVLAAMRQDGGTVDDADWISAIDHAVSQLRSQPPAEAQPVYAGVDLEGGWIRATAPPSAPVGVEAIAAEIRASLGRGATVSTRRRWAVELEALAQQPAAVDDVEGLKRLVRHLAGNPNFDFEAALAAQPGGRSDD